LTTCQITGRLKIVLTMCQNQPRRNLRDFDGSLAKDEFVRQTRQIDKSRRITKEQCFYCLSAFLPFLGPAADGRKAERQNDSGAAATGQKGRMILARQQQIPAAPDLPRNFRGFRI
jgi:hypothetical protein